MAKNSKTKSTVGAQSKKTVNRAVAVADTLHSGKRWTYTNEYERAGETLTSGAQRSNDINWCIENSAKSGIATLAQLVAKFGQTEKLFRNIGYNFSNGRWTCAGYSSPGALKRHGVAARTEQAKRGRAIVAKHSNKKIVVKHERIRCGELG